MKLGIFTFWDFAAVSQLRNEGHCAAKWHSCAKIAFAIAKYPTEWDFWCEIRLYHFAMRFAVAKWMLLCCEVALVCQNWFRSCETPFQMELSLRNGGFHALVVRSRFRSCEMGAPMLRSGTRVPKLVSQLRNTLAETSTVLRNGLATKCRFRRGCEISQTLVFPLFSLRLTPILLRFCSDFFSSISLQFLLILIIQKPILHQNKLELKH